MSAGYVPHARKKDGKGGYENRMGYAGEIAVKAAEQGIRIAVLPLQCLAELKADMEALSQQNELNGFQRWIVRERYVLSPPETEFPARSVVAAVYPMSLARAVFRYQGKAAGDLLEYEEKDQKAVLAELVGKAGFHLKYVHWMPQKRIAVRSGLCAYGRNNLTYSEEFGSFQNLATFVSDLSAERYIWREVKNAEICGGCGLCIANCPTSAILRERFLIDNERCLTRQNEWGTGGFPDWIPKSAHHRLVGCLRCQDICQMNRKRLEAVTETVEFSEAETAWLLSADKRRAVPSGLHEKLRKYQIDPAFESLPRNLAAMLANA